MEENGWIIRWSSNYSASPKAFIYISARNGESIEKLRNWLKISVEKEETDCGRTINETWCGEIEKEIEYRKLVVRKDAIEAVKEARAQGDLSENFEYYAAKKEKNQNESRIRYLERMLKTAVVISEESKEDEVGLNNTVTLYMEDDDEEETYRLVTSIRGNSLSGLISTESPIGKAILGHKVGDRVEIKVSDDFSYYVVIRKIDKTESEADDKIRSF